MGTCGSGEDGKQSGQVYPAVHVLTEESLDVALDNSTGGISWKQRETDVALLAHLTHATTRQSTTEANGDAGMHLKNTITCWKLST